MNEQRWFNFSFCEQMGHIGSEITRARIWDDKNDAVTRNRCLERALDLINMTKNDSRLYKRRRELCYLHEVVADQYISSKIYNVSMAGLEKYCLEFALVARQNR